MIVFLEFWYMFSNSAAVLQFRSYSAIPQLFRDSAAFLLFAILHVSSPGTSHMGMLVWMSTWIVCYWLGQISHVCPRSTQEHPRSNSQVADGGTTLREQLKHGFTAGTSSTPRRHRGTGSIHRFTSHDDRFLQMCTELPACCYTVN